MIIELFASQEVRQRIDEFVDLLSDAVESGASVGFLPPLSRDGASQYWLDTIADVDAGRRLLLGALHEQTLVGSVQLELATRANASHRAEVQRLLVHRAWRRHGIGERLMRRLEQIALERERTLLVLDTRQGDPSERLYQKLGYVVAGTIPGYARSADGRLTATVFYYRELGQAATTLPR